MSRFQKLNDILKVINASPNIIEFEWEENGKKIFIKRELTSIDADKTNQNTAALLSKEENNIAKEEIIHIIKAPLVGTCYLLSTQDKKAFVKIGDKVKNGQKLCVVEAMKVFKEILSEKDGEIKEILVENGQSVQYGQPLFKLVI